MSDLHDFIPLIPTGLYLINKNSPRKWYVRPLNLKRSEQGEEQLVYDMRSMDDEKHFEYFRMSKSEFDELLKLIEPLITHGQNHALPIKPIIRLAITLRFLASGISFTALAHSYRMHKSTVMGIVYEVCDALWFVLKEKYLAFPNQEQWNHISSEFSTKWNFPNCIGAIDGKHIALKCPANRGSEFYNYKNFHSIVLLACVDANYCFTVIDIGASGRESDGGIFTRSSFGKCFENNSSSIPLDKEKELPNSTEKLPLVFVADDAFPLRNNIMKPYPRQGLNDYKKKVFNYRLSRARRISENAFGILALKWRVLRQTLEVTPDHGVVIVRAIVVLHNFMRKTARANTSFDRYCKPSDFDHETSDGLIPGEWRNESISSISPLEQQGSSNFVASAANVRQAFSTYFCGAGAVPWQDAIVNRGRLFPNQQ